MTGDTLILGLNPAWQRLFLLDEFKPGEVNRLSKAEEFASGKGINCARVLRLLGGDFVLVHFLGGERSVSICDEIAAVGIRQLPIWIGSPTRICTTIVSKGDTTELIEPSPILTESENRDFMQTIGESWSDVTNVALCGSFPLNFRMDSLSELDLAKKRLFVDAVDGVDSWLEHGVELLKVNMFEYCKLLQRMGIPQITSSPQFWKMTASTLLERLPIQNLVVTDEESPVRAFYMLDGKFQYLRLTPPQVKVVNDVGAGDSFLAGWLAADFLGLPVEDRLAKATAVASARCEVDRPWNIDLARVSAFESQLLSQVEKVTD
ncbi:MAG: PfkB family carbohydrate kinase [Fibrobacteraceae bacterium]